VDPPVDEEMVGEYLVVAEDVEEGVDVLAAAGDVDGDGDGLHDAGSVTPLPEPARAA
jgi:hypothetical protein